MLKVRGQEEKKPNHPVSITEVWPELDLSGASRRQGGPCFPAPEPESGHSTHAHRAQSDLYATAFTAAGRPQRFLLYPTGGHEDGFYCDLEVRTWPEDAMKGMGKSFRRRSNPLTPIG